MISNWKGLSKKFTTLNSYENLPMQYTEIFIAIKMKIFSGKIFDIFLIFAQNIDCGYTLEPTRQGGSTEYPQSMLCKNKNKNAAEVDIASASGKVNGP